MSLACVEVVKNIKNAVDAENDELTKRKFDEETFLPLNKQNES